MIAGGGLVLLLLILFAYILQVRSLSSVNDDIDAQVEINAESQGQISSLQRVQDLQDQADVQRQLLASVFSSELSFSGTLLDISRVIPADAYFTTLTITVTPPVAAASTTTGNPNQIGTIAFSGEGVSVDTVASLLGSLDQVHGWVNAYVAAVNRPGSTSVVQFNGTVDLTIDALTERGRTGLSAGATG